MIFFDKAHGISRVVGYETIVESGSSFEKKCLSGWEEDLFLSRDKQGDAYREIARKEKLDYTENLHWNIQFIRNIRNKFCGNSMLSNNINYWKWCSYIFLSLTLICLSLAFLVIMRGTIIGDPDYLNEVCSAGNEYDVFSFTKKACFIAGKALLFLYVVYTIYGGYIYSLLIKRKPPQESTSKTLLFSKWRPNTGAIEILSIIVFCFCVGFIWVAVNRAMNSAYRGIFNAAATADYAKIPARLAYINFSLIIWIVVMMITFKIICVNYNAYVNFADRSKINSYIMSRKIWRKILVDRGLYKLM